MKRSKAMMLGVATLVLCASGGVMAGPINPPVGPVGPTGKPLAELEPRVAVSAANTPGDADADFVISQAGSYCVTGNMTGGGTKSAIKIMASGVTLDLRGFALSGGGSSAPGIAVVGAGLHSIVISNGTVTGWGLSGIDMFAATLSRAEGIRASSNGGAGLRLGSQTIVRHCTATQNAGRGISTQESCTVTECVVGANPFGGISTQSNCVVEGCTVEACASGSGIEVFNGCTVVRCGVTGCTNGIQTSGDCTVTACSVRFNSGTGIFTGIGSTVGGCTSGSNTGDGIRVSSGSSVIGNTCRTNGFAGGLGAGIHATGADNRIEGNNCTGADRGIDVDVAGNFIARNVCSGNTTLNWDVVAGNVCLVVDALAGGAAISGNAGGAATSTDGNANFTY